MVPGSTNMSNDPVFWTLFVILSLLPLPAFILIGWVFQTVAGRSRAKKAAKPMGITWLYLWTYLVLPSLVIEAIVKAFEAKHTVTLFGVVAITAIILIFGLHKRKCWSWQLNWIVITYLYIKMIFPNQTPGKPQDEGALLATALYCIIVAAPLWLWPNYVYWKKRKCLFYGSDALTQQFSATTAIHQVGFAVLGTFFAFWAFMGFFQGMKYRQISQWRGTYQWYDDVFGFLMLGAIVFTGCWCFKKALNKS